MLEFIGEAVHHNFWDNGIIVQADGNKIIVHFDKIQADKKFIYPDSFEQYLVFENPALQAVAISAIDAEKKRQQEEKASREAERKKQIEEHPIIVDRSRNGAGKRKLPPRKNIAFKLNYCNGGASAESVGYKAVCSDDVIRYNILEAKHSWCTYIDCPCSKYLEGDITRTELDEIRKTGFTCYESIAMSDWIAHAGMDLKGENKRKARRLPNAQRGSLAILTTRYPGSKEADRIIVGVFIVDAVSEGSDDKEGKVSCRSKYHIEIRPNEVQKLKFWNYYRNERNPDNVFWGTGLYRFFKDEDAHALLEDIVEIKKGSVDFDLAVDTLKYFEELHAD